MVFGDSKEDEKSQTTRVGEILGKRKRESEDSDPSNPETLEKTQEVESLEVVATVEAVENPTEVPTDAVAVPTTAQSHHNEGHYDHAKDTVDEEKSRSRLKHLDDVAVIVRDEKANEED